ncbi:hypothetical protein LRS74_28540 [Streptomyces sp. LX-29]|uniref:hypothetical protein n=1 Tax=Streptomyces sp. LX-29 TaxID=2900152 RepID=UPI00240D7311|nr:hypothetical protein [Streptomyces sp. LX-29]WFB10538.1 hypothetical protein LRS74_28540 [Streptomyces sp. LX-29]
MGPDEVVALTAVAGAALVQAAGTDAWAGMRTWASRWWGRLDEQRQRAELERLDAARTALSAADEPEAAHQAGYWSGRFEMLLELLPPEARAEAVAELRALVGQRPPAHGATIVNVSGDGPVSVQSGDHNHMVNHFGSGA